METTETEATTNRHRAELPAEDAPHSHPTLVKALIAAQRRVRTVAKKATNTFHGYKYASADAIIDEASEALAMEGLAVLPVSVGRDPQQVDHVWEKATCFDDKGVERDDSWIRIPRRILAVYMLIHESGEEREFSSSTPVIPEKGRPEDKAEFGARTENLGYALRDLLLIPREDQSVLTPSARDDRNVPPPRAPAPKPEPAPSAGPWRAQGDDGTLILDAEVEEFDELIKSLAWKSQYVGMFLGQRFGIKDANVKALTRQQFKAVAKLLMANGQGKEKYQAALKEAIETGQVKP